MITFWIFCLIVFCLFCLFCFWRESRICCVEMHRKSTKKTTATHNNIYLYNTNCDTMNFQIFKTLPILELLRSRVRLVKALALSSAPWNASLILSSVCVMFVSFLNSIEKRTITLPFLAKKKLNYRYNCFQHLSYLEEHKIKIPDNTCSFFVIFIRLLEVIDVGTVKITSNWAVLEK